MTPVIVAAVLAATSTPTPKAPNADLVTPGVWGFLITLLIGVATILLIMDMVRRTRRVTYRAQVKAKLDAEEAARQGPGTGVGRRAGGRPGAQVDDTRQR